VKFNTQVLHVRMYINLFVGKSSSGMGESTIVWLQGCSSQWCGNISLLDHQCRRAFGWFTLSYW